MLFCHHDSRDHKKVWRYLPDTYIYPVLTPRPGSELNKPITESLNTNHCLSCCVIESRRFATLGLVTP